MSEEDILGDLDWEIEESGAVEITTLPDFALVGLFAQQKAILLELGEVLKPKTDRGREVHSVYYACLLEMKRRGL